MQANEIDWFGMTPDETHRLPFDHKVFIIGLLAVVSGFGLMLINGSFEGSLELGIIGIGAILLLLGALGYLQPKYVMWFASRNTFVVYHRGFLSKSSNFISLVYEVQKGDRIQLEHEVQRFERVETDIEGHRFSSTDTEHVYWMLIERADGTVVESTHDDVYVAGKGELLKLKEIFSSKRMD